MKQAAFAILIFISTGLVGAYAQDLTAQSDGTTFNGFFNFHYQEAEGKIFLEVTQGQLGRQFLYVSALRTGLGSNE